MLNTRDAFALDGHTPSRVLRPDNTEALAAAIAEAHATGLAIIPWGGGTHQHLGNRVARYDWAVSTAGLDRILEHHPADMLVTVEAGVTLQALQAHLATHGQFVPLEAEDPARATIGGLLSAGVAGPQRLAHGTARDFTLWLEAVRADGTIVHGGAKVVKNVAGYDTPKLFLGSLGSAGVITQAAFKVLPLPPTRWTTLLGFYSLDQAEDLLAVLTAGRLQPSLVTVVKGDPAWGMPFDLAPWVVAVGADGEEATTDWQVDRFLTLGREAHMASGLAVDGEESDRVRQALMTRRTEGLVRLKLSVLPDQVVPVLAQLDLLAMEGFYAFAEAGSGVIRACWPYAWEGWAEAAALVHQLGGSWVLESAPPEWKVATDVWGPPRGDRALMRRLKETLDPRGVLSPGRFTGG